MTRQVPVQIDRVTRQRAVQIDRVTRQRAVQNRPRDSSPVCVDRPRDSSGVFSPCAPRVCVLCPACCAGRASGPEALPSLDYPSSRFRSIASFRQHLK